MGLRYVIRSIFLSILLVLLFGISATFAATEVIEFELEIELINGEEYEVEYELKGKEYEATYQVPGSPILYGEDAKAMIEPLINRLAITQEKDEQELIEEIYEIYNIEQGEVSELELEVKFNDGTKIKISRK